MEDTKMIPRLVRAQSLRLGDRRSGPAGSGPGNDFWVVTKISLVAAGTRKLRVTWTGPDGQWMTKTYFPKDKVFILDEVPAGDDEIVVRREDEAPDDLPLLVLISVTLETTSLVLDDLKKVIGTALPYMADNVTISYEITERWI